MAKSKKVVKKAVAEHTPLPTPPFIKRIVSELMDAAQDACGAKFQVEFTKLAAKVADTYQRAARNKINEVRKLTAAKDRTERLEARREAIQFKIAALQSQIEA
jgi:hypothetical protein